MEQEIRDRIEKIKNGEVPERYRKQINFIAPIGWKVQPLGDVIDYKKGFAFKSKDYTDHGIRIIRISDTTYNSINNEDPIYLSEKEKDKYVDYVLNCGDIVVSSVGSRPPLYDSMVGKIIRIPKNVEGSLLNQNAVRLRAKKQYNQDFIYNCLKVKRYIYHIESIARGNANQVSITLEDFFSYLIAIPPLPEQQKISTILSTWDKAIELKEQLIEEKKKQKKGLMQKLLTGEVRLPGFDGELEYNNLTGYIKESVIRNKEGLESIVLSVTNKQGFVLQEQQFDRIIASKDLTNYKIIYRNQFAYNPSRVNVGSIDLLTDFDKGLLSPMYVVFECMQGLDFEYLYQFLKSDMFMSQVPNLLQGSVRDSLSFDSLTKVKLVIPNLNEQNQITNLLKNSDKEINLLQQELEALKLQKKGLMQLLLTGIARVNTEN